jgi:hypothetical protein
MHHTKQKADVGVAKVIADLVEKGYVPCIPLSEHQAYDLVAVDTRGVAYKLQVKYSTSKKNGSVEIRFRTSWANKQGTHIKHYRSSDFDYYAVYCPDRNKVLYIPHRTGCPKVVRFDQSANNQLLGVHWAKDYLNIQRESSETTRRTPEMVKT